MLSKYGELENIREDLFNSSYKIVCCLDTDDGNFLSVLVYSSS